MTVNQYLMFANNKLQEDAENNRRNYGECEIVSYITDVKIKTSRWKHQNISFRIS